MGKEVADLKNELKLLRDKTRKQKLEIETQVIRQKTQLTIIQCNERASSDF